MKPYSLETVLRSYLEHIASIVKADISLEKQEQIYQDLKSLEDVLQRSSHDSATHNLYKSLLKGYEEKSERDRKLIGEKRKVPKEKQKADVNNSQDIQGNLTIKSNYPPSCACPIRQYMDYDDDDEDDRSDDEYDEEEIERYIRRYGENRWEEHQR